LAASRLQRRRRQRRHPRRTHAAVSEGRNFFIFIVIAKDVFDDDLVHHPLASASARHQRR
jgi:hypothetical protein